MTSALRIADVWVRLRPGPDARVLTEEIFGPVLALAGYEDLDDPIGRANGNPIGLAGYVCGTDVARAEQVGRRLGVGIAGVNTGAPNTPRIPLAPRRGSGLGVEGGPAEFTAYQSVAIASPG